MTTHTTALARRSGLRNKVPEITVWFRIIKIPCTSVGEGFADYINETLGLGLVNTTVPPAPARRGTG